MGKYRPKEVRSDILAALACHCDSAFVESGFKRRANAIVFRRSIDRCTQRIHLSPDFTGMGDRSASGALFPYFDVEIPAVSKVLTEMTSAPNSRIQLGSPTLRMQIGMAAEKEHTGTWHIHDRDSIAVCVKGFRDFCIQYLLPLLNEITTARDLIAAFQTKDNRLSWHETVYFTIAAAAISLDERGVVSEIIDSRLSSIGARKRFGNIRCYLENYLAQ